MMNDFLLLTCVRQNFYYYFVRLFFYMRCATSGFDKTWKLKLPRINIFSCDGCFMTVMVNFNKVHGKYTPLQ